MNPARRHRAATVWLCAAALLLLGFIAQRHALSHALTSVNAQAPHVPVAGHAQACELCLQLVGTDAPLPPAATAIVSAALGRCKLPAAALPCPVEAFVAYASRAPPHRG